MYLSATTLFSIRVSLELRRKRPFSPGLPSPFPRVLTRENHKINSCPFFVPRIFGLYFSGWASKLPVAIYLLRGLCLLFPDRRSDAFIPITWERDKSFIFENKKEKRPLRARERERKGERKGWRRKALWFKPRLWGLSSSSRNMQTRVCSVPGVTSVRILQRYFARDFWTSCHSLHLISPLRFYYNFCSRRFMFFL